jgi:GNAT superfamily N-acetyltransferase
LNFDTDNSLVLNGVSTEAASPVQCPEENGDKGFHHDPAIRIRPYRGTDRGAICRLCCETGFLGEPVDALFQDRELFADLFTRPYLDHEPEWVFIAEANRQVIGYVLGSVGRHFELILLRSGFWTASRMLLRLASGRYQQHPRSRLFIRWLLTSGFREQPLHPPNSAHLHLQVEKKYRGRGLGRRLWEHYEKQIQSVGIKQYYGAFYSFPQRRPEMAYARYGFRVFDRRKTTLFQPEIRDPVEVVCVSKKF